MDLKDLDLNLLVVFNELLAQRRVSRVAERLGMSQPAVSNALARLRRQFDDELFLRTAKGMEPTPLALGLADAVGEALGMLHNAINQRDHFDPASSRRAFTIGMSDIGEIYFLPRLFQLLGEQAPQVVVSTVRESGVNLQDAMADGRVDLAIGLLPQLKAGFYQQRLFRQRYVCVHRQGHPLHDAPLTLESFLAHEHVVVVAAGTGHGQVDEHMRREGLTRRVRLTVPHFVAVGHILQATDLLATVPQRLAQNIVQPFGLHMAEHPVPLPDMAINLFWHARYHRDPANQWLRHLFFRLFADLGAVG